MLKHVKDIALWTCNPLLQQIPMTKSHETAFNITTFKFLRHLLFSFFRSTLEFLSNEGHIYSTIDDDHYKSTDSY